MADRRINGIRTQRKVHRCAEHMYMAFLYVRISSTYFWKSRVFCLFIPALGQPWP